MLLQTNFFFNKWHPVLFKLIKMLHLEVESIQDFFDFSLTFICKPVAENHQHGANYGRG